MYDVYFDVSDGAHLFVAFCDKESLASAILQKSVVIVGGGGRALPFITAHLTRTHAHIHYEW